MQIFWDISPTPSAATHGTAGSDSDARRLHATLLLTQSLDHGEGASGFPSAATRESIMAWAAEENGMGRYIGRCRVVDLRHAGHIIQPKHLSGHLFGKMPHVLIRTQGGLTNHAVLSVEAIKLLSSCGVKLLGIDTPSLDAPNSMTQQSYKAAAQAGMSLLLNLALKEVTNGDYEMLALPLGHEKAGSLKDLEIKHAKNSTTRAA